jgi:hypothetical protein
MGPQARSCERCERPIDALQVARYAVVAFGLRLIALSERHQPGVGENECEGDPLTLTLRALHEAHPARDFRWVRRGGFLGPAIEWSVPCMAIRLDTGGGWDGVDVHVETPDSRGFTSGSSRDLRLNLFHQHPVESLAESGTAFDVWSSLFWLVKMAGLQRRGWLANPSNPCRCKYKSELRPKPSSN